MRAAGVADRVTVLCEDYRDLRGHYEKLVSIEMIEAVGWRDFDTFFARCSNLLADDGRMLLQAIVIDDRAYTVEKASQSFIRTHIFPDGCLPSLEVIARCLARRTDMRTVAVRDLTPHYAETLIRWRANFEAAAAHLHDIGYDERFRRLWRMYLAYCEAGFAERRIGVVQMHLAKPAWRQHAHYAHTRERPLAVGVLGVEILSAGQNREGAHIDVEMADECLASSRGDAQRAGRVAGGDPVVGIEAGQEGGCSPAKATPRHLGPIPRGNIWGSGRASSTSALR